MQKISSCYWRWISILPSRQE